MQLWHWFYDWGWRDRGSGLPLKNSGGNLNDPNGQCHTQTKIILVSWHDSCGVTVLSTTTSYSASALASVAKEGEAAQSD
jgi:hypothetical protein